MAPRSSWKGFLRLSLVSVPVRAFTAHDTEGEIHLNQLHDACNGRVRYLKICPEHGELKNTDIVNGYEFAKDQYVVIDPSEVAKLRSESDKSVHIEGFIDSTAIDPIYFAGKSHYLLPDGTAGNRAYALLHRGMVDASVCAIGQVVLAGREQLVLLRPVENLIIMCGVFYANKVKGMDEFRGEMPEMELKREELDLTQTLIQASRLEEFDLKTYADPYTDKLNKLIQLKVEGQEVVQVSDPHEPKIINLMEALKQSVAAAQLAAPRKMAPSAKTAEKPARGAGRRKSG